MAMIKEIHPPEEGLLYTNDSVHLKIGKQILECGILYISEDYLLWKPESRNEGISIPWKQISLHGISSNPAKYIYIMLDHKLNWEGVYDPNLNMNGVNNGHGLDGDDDNDENDGQINDAPAANANNDDSDNDEGNVSDDCAGEQNFTELWLIPSNTNCVNNIFQIMTQCQALNPDSADDSISDESNFMDAQDIEDIGDDDDDHNDVSVQRDMRNLNISDEKFADAED